MFDRRSHSLCQRGDDIGPEGGPGAKDWQVLFEVGEDRFGSHIRQSAACLERVLA